MKVLRAEEIRDCSVSFLTQLSSSPLLLVRAITENLSITKGPILEGLKSIKSEWAASWLFSNMFHLL